MPKIIAEPYTPKGKLSKYPLCLKFSTINFGCHNEPPNSYKAEIYYLQDGSIGKARIVCRDRGIYVVNLGMKGTTLVIKNIQKTKLDGTKEFLYKEN